MRNAVLDGREFEQIQILRDRPSEAVAVVVVHDTRLGPAFGGIRRHAYRTFDEGLEDALRLAESMSWKCALAGVKGGGAKTVIFDSEELDRVRAYELIGSYVEEMGGRYYTGPDVGTEEADLESVARKTQYVARAVEEGPGPLGEPTARGVLAGVRAVAKRLDFSELEGLDVVVQGLGAVGARLVRDLVAEGAKVRVTDVAQDRVKKAVEEHGVESIEPGEAAQAKCDVFCPCAFGGIVHDISLSSLGARAIVGSANNVLASPEHGDVLYSRGILYAPDFVVNAGALIHGATFHLEGKAPAPERIDQIGDVVGDLLDEAHATGIPPERLAVQRARRMIETSQSEPFLPRKGTDAK